MIEEELRGLDDDTLAFKTTREGSTSSGISGQLRECQHPGITPRIQAIVLDGMEMLLPQTVLL